MSDIVFERALDILSMVQSHCREDAVHVNHPLSFQHMPCVNMLHTQEDLFEITNWVQYASDCEGITTLTDGIIGLAMTMCAYKRAWFLLITALMGFFAIKGLAGLIEGM